MRNFETDLENLIDLSHRGALKYGKYKTAKDAFVEKYGDRDELVMRLTKESNEMFDEIEKLKEDKKVSVPSFVDVGIKNIPEYFNAYGAIKIIEGKVINSNDSIDWAGIYAWVLTEGNSDTFSIAWIYGYTVENEKIYNIKLGEGNNSYLNIDLKTGRILISNKDASEKCKTEFTETEIKYLDKRYLPFTVPVDEKNV